MIPRREDMRIDRRHQRATAITAAVMRELRHIIKDDEMKEVHRCLFDLFYENGLSIMTDEDRANEGFEPRDAKGWTPSERVLHEQRYLEALMKMMEPQFVTVIGGEIFKDAKKPAPLKGRAEFEIEKRE